MSQRICIQSRRAFFFPSYTAIDDLCDLHTHILQGFFAGTEAIISLPQCQWQLHYCLSASDKILKNIDETSPHITTTKHNKA